MSYSVHDTIIARVSYKIDADYIVTLDKRITKRQMCNEYQRTCI
jgi:hypothetical protein